MRDIKPINNNGSIQLKFSVAGQRYSFNPVPGGNFSNKRDLQTAESIAVRIKNDILAGNFDDSLGKYRLIPKRPQKTLSKIKNFLELWDLWVESLQLAPSTKAGEYDRVRSMLSKSNPSVEDTDFLVKSKLSASTFNKRLGYLKSCLRWGIGKGLVESNPFELVKSRKKSPKEIKPFTEAEILSILEGFDRIAPHYSSFVRFLVATGVRTSEAVGLRWGHIDFEKGEVTICESLPRDRTSNGYKKIRKQTKTGSIRTLSLSVPLEGMLRSLKPDQVDLDDLVFQSPEECIIDATNFRERYWKPILKTIGVTYRVPYNLRHTFISHAIEQNIPITGIAYMAGHRDSSMVVKIYGRVVNRPRLPEMPF